MTSENMPGFFCRCSRGAGLKTTPRSYAIVCPDCEGLRYIEAIAATAEYVSVPGTTS
jgi:hypothetical protein